MAKHMNGLNTATEIAPMLKNIYTEYLLPFEKYQRDNKVLTSPLNFVNTSDLQVPEGNQQHFELTKVGGTLGLALGDRWGCQVVVTGTPKLGNGTTSPAQIAGMLPGDILLLVGGNSVEGLPLQKVAEILRDAGNPV